MSNSLQPHGLQHTRLPCPSLSPWVGLNSRPLSQWCHPTISSSVAHFSSCPQSFPASGSFPMSWLFLSGGQSIGATLYQSTWWVHTFYYGKIQTEIEWQSSIHIPMTCLQQLFHLYIPSLSIYYFWSKSQASNTFIWEYFICTYSILIWLTVTEENSLRLTFSHTEINGSLSVYHSVQIKY